MSAADQIEMGDCPACAQAKIRTTCGRFIADCASCAARSVAMGPAHFEARQAGIMTASYRAELVRVAGAGALTARVHAQVKLWGALIEAERAAKPPKIA